MNDGEREPQPVAGLYDIVEHLQEGEGLLLSRNSAHYVGPAGTDGPWPIHYEGLDDISTQEYPAGGRLVTEEFRSAAEHIRAQEEYVRRGPVYPLLTVVNNVTGAAQSRVVDVAELVVQRRVVMRSLLGRSLLSGEMVSSDYSPLIKELAWKVEVNPDNSYVVLGKRAIAMRDIDLQSWTPLPKEFGLAGVEPVAIDPRGEAALDLIQMETSSVFSESRYRRRLSSRARVAVELRMATRPDVQTVMLSLIDLAESQGTRLYYRKGLIPVEGVGSIFSLVNDNIEHIETLSSEMSLDMAIYTAYTVALDIFPNHDH